MECLGYDSKLHLVMRLVFWKSEYPSFAITPWSPMTLSGCIVRVPLSVKEICLKITWYHKTVFKLFASERNTWWWGSSGAGALGTAERSSLSKLPGPLWPGMVTPDRALSMGRTELNCILMLNWIVWIGIVWLNWIAWNRDVFDNKTV